MNNFDDLKLAVEALSGAKNTVKLDDLGMPSIVVAFPRLNYADVLAGGSQDPLPAFIVDGQVKDVIYVGKYQSVVVNNRAYSLPMKEPARPIIFDDALQMCRNKGAGWHLSTNALYAAIALWCKRNGTMPRGNNRHGEDGLNPHEKGVPIGNPEATGRIRRTATGSGPPSWYHNYHDSGIADLNGNAWEWAAGLRIVDGEIQIINNGNAMKHDCNMSPTSTEWRAIMPDGTLVAPGTPGTLKWDYTIHNPGTNVTQIHLIAGNLTNQQADSTPSGRQAFGSLVAQSGVTIPAILHALGLFPADPSEEYANNGHFWVRNFGEQLPVRGGAYNNVGQAGVFSLNNLFARSHRGSEISFRAAFYE